MELRWLPVAGVSAGWTGYVLPVLSLAALATGYITAVHAMRPSLIPVATFVAANLGQLVTGLIIVEGVFRVPGVGGLLFDAIGARDRSVADVVVAALDPRVRLRA